MTHRPTPLGGNSFSTQMVSLWAARVKENHPGFLANWIDQSPFIRLVVLGGLLLHLLRGFFGFNVFGWRRIVIKGIAAVPKCRAESNGGRQVASGFHFHLPNFSLGSVQ